MVRRVRVLGMLLLAVVTGPAGAAVQSLDTGGFSFGHDLVLPVEPERAWELLTGDVSGWWDHTFSEKPLELFIDARPGGGFYEIFDQQGNGARHAEVLFAHRGKRLILRGPLGLTGNALDMVFTFEFTPVPGGTRLSLQGRGAGQLDPAWPAAVDRVWRHFLFERLLPYARRTCAEQGVCIQEK